MMALLESMSALAHAALLKIAVLLESGAYAELAAVTGLLAIAVWFTGQRARRDDARDADRGSEGASGDGTFGLDHPIDLDGDDHDERLAIARRLFIVDAHDASCAHDHADDTLAYPEVVRSLAVHVLSRFADTDELVRALNLLDGPASHLAPAWCAALAMAPASRFGAIAARWDELSAVRARAAVLAAAVRRGLCTGVGPGTVPGGVLYEAVVLVARAGGSGEPALRRAAAAACRRLPPSMQDDPRVGALLHALLEDDVRTVRFAAARTLATMALRRAKLVPVLGAAVCSAEFWTRAPAPRTSQAVTAVAPRRARRLDALFATPHNAAQINDQADAMLCRVGRLVGVTLAWSAVCAQRFR